MYQGRESYSAWAGEVRALESGQETCPYHPDGETTACVTRDGDAYVLHVQAVDAFGRVDFDKSETFDIFGVLGAGGML